MLTANNLFVCGITSPALSQTIDIQKVETAHEHTITGLVNHIDYGFGAGVELNPAKGFLIGGRYNP